MSGLAKHFLESNYTVSGSDEKQSELTYELQTLGATVKIGHSAENVLGADSVVYTHAISENNPELVYAREKGINVFRRSQVLGEVLSWHEKSVAVSGSHGKTTTTAMIANALIENKKDPTVFLGGEDYSFGNYRRGDGTIAVAEACEYKKSFLDIKSDISVVLNVDDDHLDCYKDITSVQNAFKMFAQNSIAVINADDQRASKIFNSTTVTFGIENTATYTAKNIKENQAFYSFTACAYGRTMGRINLSVFGKHNIYNALATVAVCDLLRLPFHSVKKAIESFKGVKRRNECIGEYMHKTCYCDYAHHPREISATLLAHSKSSKSYLTVFQPHTYSRTKLLMQDFIGVFKQVSPLIILQTYSARENFDKEGSALTLYENLKSAGNERVYFAKNEQELSHLLQECLQDETERLLFLGAGDIYEKAKNILVQKNDKKI